MLSATEQLDIINNDAKLLAMTTKDGNVLRLSGEVFPDGQPFTGNIEGEMNFNVIQSWLSNVRGVWNARQASKEAAETCSAAARRDHQEREASGSVNGGGGRVPVEDDPQVSEASLEATLRSQITLLDRAYRRWSDVGSAATAQLTIANNHLARISRELQFAERMLKELNDDDTPEDGASDSVELYAAQEPGTIRDGDSEGVV